MTLARLARDCAEVEARISALERECTRCHERQLASGRGVDIESGSRRAHPRSPLGIALTRPTDSEPARRQILALALLADVEPRIAQRALREGAGSIAGDAGHRIAIAMSAMRGDDAAEAAYVRTRDALAFPG